MTKTKISFIALLIIVIVLGNYRFLIKKESGCFIDDNIGKIDENTILNNDDASKTSKNKSKINKNTNTNEEEVNLLNDDGFKDDLKKEDSIGTSVENKKTNEINDSGKYSIFNQMLVDKSWFNNGNNGQFSNFWGSENIENIGETYKIKYPKGSTIPSEFPRGGAGFIYDTGKKYDKLSLSYNLKFEQGFDFVKGGKLPGLCGGDCSRGGMPTDKGFSVRFVWRKNGYLDLQYYLPKSSNLGDYSGKQIFKMIPGKEYIITQEIILNDIGKSNGILNVLVDGKKMYSKNDLYFRVNNDVQITSLLFSTFFGGKGADWASTKDTYIYLKDFKISE